MINIIKKSGKRVAAYRLGGAHPMLDRLMAEGRLRQQSDGSFEVMSQEAVGGASGKGEIAHAGDYIKIDGMGYPYPNDAQYFRENHRHIEEDEYEQIPRPMQAWTASEPMCEEIEFLLREKGLVIDLTDEKRYFTAPLWGTTESAAKDAVVVFYSVDRDERGAITDISFNFVCREEFDRTYEVC